MTDLHIHTQLSYDSEERAENYIERAVSGKEGYIGFCEHYDLDVRGQSPADPEKLIERRDRLNSAQKEVETLCGLEFGYGAGAVEEYKKLCSLPLDYLMMSVHTVKGRGDCYFPEFFKGLDREQAYKSYLGAVYESVCADIDYQIVGHLGYVTRYAPYADKSLAGREFAAIVDGILREIISRGAALEINSKAKGACDTVLPERKIIERYISLGGKNFTYGSDSHKAEYYGVNAPAVSELLLSLGVTEICRFKRKKPIREKL